MHEIPNGKYKAYPQIDLPSRQWPTKTITTVPAWCSVDLRDEIKLLSTLCQWKKNLNFSDSYSN